MTRRLRVPGGLQLGQPLCDERRRRGQAVHLGLEDGQGARAEPIGGRAEWVGKAAGRAPARRISGVCARAQGGSPPSCHAAALTHLHVLPTLPALPPDRAVHQVPRLCADRLPVAPAGDQQGGHLQLGQRRHQALGEARGRRGHGMGCETLPVPAALHAPWEMQCAHGSLRCCHHPDRCRTEAVTMAWPGSKQRLCSRRTCPAVPGRPPPLLFRLAPPLLFRCCWLCL